MIEEIIAAKEEIEVVEEEIETVEEITIRVSKLWERLQGVLGDAQVQHVVVKNHNGRILFELPLYLGIAGAVLLKSWTALGLIIGFLAEVTITVERRTPILPRTADDLQAIIGIGPQVHHLLQDAGITTFAQLAATHPEHLRQILVAAGANYDHINPVSWPTQASQLIKEV